MKIYSKKARTFFNKLLGYRIKNWNLFVLAFTRSSFEEKRITDINTNEVYDVSEGNENLEFLGDKALYGVIGYILSKIYTPLREKNISDDSYYCTDYIVPTEKISIEELKRIYHNVEDDLRHRFTPVTPDLLTYISECISRNSNLANYINNCQYIENKKPKSIKDMMLIGKTDINNNVLNQEKVLADLFEAIVGAIALDCNFNIRILSRAVIRLMNNDYNIWYLTEPKINNLAIFNFDGVNPTNCVEMMNLLNQKGIYGKPIYTILSKSDLEGRTLLEVKCEIPEFISSNIKNVKPQILGEATAKGFNFKDARRTACFEAIQNLQNNDIEEISYHDIDESEIDYIDDEEELKCFINTEVLSDVKINIIETIINKKFD